MKLTDVSGQINPGIVQFILSLYYSVRDVDQLCNLTPTNGQISSQTSSKDDDDDDH